MSTDEFGDRMKDLEMVEAGRRLMPLLPALARLDGKNFSGFTRGMERPFDKRMSDLMVATTKFLVEETNAVCGYCQSDEITLAWYSPDYKSQIYFDGRIQKMTSVLAATATAVFNKMMPQFLPEPWISKMPVFDCRVWNVPTLMEATNAFLWRENDATKNSISMAARCYYSHKELHLKNGSEMQEMLFAQGVNWNNYPDFFRRGTYIQRRKISRTFNVEELEKLPPKHEARTDPNLIVERTEVSAIDLPPLNKVTNRVAVLFFGADYKLSKEEDGQIQKQGDTV